MKRGGGGLFRLIGAINIILGAWVIERNFGWLFEGSIWEWAFMLKGDTGGFPLQERILIFALSLIVVPLLPIGKIVTGGGLLCRHRWARRWTILVVLVDFLIKLYSTINFVNLEPAIPSIPYHGGNTVMMIMLPIYIIALFDLLVIAVLTREEIRVCFEQRRTEEERQE